MKSIKPIIMAMLSLILLLNCVSTRIARLNNIEYDPTNPEDVIIYMKEADIKGEFEKIAIIFAKGNYNSTDEEDMFKKVKEEAAKLGANGVLLEDIEDPGTGAKVANAFLGISADRKGKMIAIRVKQ